ncbi:MAG TPA: acyl-phosphate glycerol 3-phosphate acyltransferase [Rhodobiaceae bacterium]|nr:acyl-phosphate glycerol 3-phosphate acyltransferase [Rhodobiaceae bacterium]
MTDTSTIIGVLVLAYLLGSIPFGLLFSRMGGLGDIRETGSGNIGATNVLRSGNKLLAALTLLTDAAKGSVAIFIALDLVGFPAAYWAGLAALLGHIFPVWLGFKGGKGVAIFIGTGIVLSPLPGLSMLSVWLLVALIFRRSSLAALVATLSVPLYMAVLGEIYGAVVVGVQVGVIYWAHRDNISRLRKGQEPRIGRSA